MGWNKDFGKSAKVNADYAKVQGDVAKQEASNLSKLKTDVEVATQNASTAADNAVTATSNADNAASEAIAQANHAKNEGDRAKAEADRLAGTDVSLLDNKIGSLSSLNTTNKTSVVESVNEVAQQLAQTASKEELKTKRDKGTKITNSDLDTSSDTNKIKLVNLANEVQLALTGNAPALSVIPEKGVVLENIGFFDLGQRNLYDKNAVTKGYYVEGDGVLTPGAPYEVSDYIKVKPGDNYFVSQDFNINFYNSEKVRISTLLGGWKQRLGNGNILTVPANAYLMRVTATSSFSNFMVVKGNTEPTKYTPFGEYEVKIVDGQLTKTIKEIAVGKNAVPIDSLEVFTTKSVNLFDETKATIGYYVDAFNGNLVAGAGYKVSDYIPVKPSTNYVMTENMNVAFYNSAKVFISGKGGGWQQPLSTPATTAFMRVSFNKTGDKMVAEGSTLPNYVPFEYKEINFTNDQWKASMQKALGVQKGNNSPLNGLKWNVLGDSITFGAGANGYPYHRYIAERTGVIVNNYGISGSTVAKHSNPMSERYVNMSDDADIITVLGGINDSMHMDKIGVMADRTNESFYGALHVLYRGLITKYPGKKIGIITPLQRGYSHQETKTIVDIVKEVAEYYSLPVLDLFRSGGLTGNVNSVFSQFVPDLLHPNELGQKVISRRIEAFLLTL